MNISDVIKHFKSKILVADALKITSGAISQWGETIPEKQAMRLERITNGELKYDPSLYGQNKQ